MEKFPLQRKSRWPIGTKLNLVAITFSFLELALTEFLVASTDVSLTRPFNGHSAMERASLLPVDDGVVETMVSVLLPLIIKARRSTEIARHQCMP